MKNNFRHFYRSSSIAVCLFFIGCSANSKESSDKYILNDVLTFERSFGTEDTISNEEYLLANPMGLAVDGKGNIYLADEQRIKVYDSEGKEKTMFGSPGQGPGEIQSDTELFIGPTGLVAAGWGKPNLFSPEGEFIKVINIGTENRVRSAGKFPAVPNYTIYKMYPIDHNKIIGYGQGYEVSLETRQRARVILVYSENEEINVVAEYVDPTTILFDRFGSVFTPAGKLHWSVAANGQLVYAHARHDTENDNGKFTYALNVFSAKDKTTTSLVHHFEPVSIPDSMKVNLTKRYKAIDNPRAQSMAGEIDRIIAPINFYGGMQKVIADHHTIFVFTYKQNEDGEYLVDIFDLEEKKYLHSAFFPLIPRVIKNRKAYLLKKGKDILPVVEIYKVSDKIYKK